MFKHLQEISVCGILFLMLLSCSSDNAESGCTSAADCLQGQLCTDGVCVARRGCESDTDCGEGAICLDGYCENAPAIDGDEEIDDDYPEEEQDLEDDGDIDETSEDEEIELELPDGDEQEDMDSELPDGDDDCMCEQDYEFCFGETYLEQGLKCDEDNLLSCSQILYCEGCPGPCECSPQVCDGVCEEGEEPGQAVCISIDGDTEEELDQIDADQDTIFTASECWANKTGEIGPDYDQFGPIIGSHCMGTNHQDIQGVQKVVFLGDSITEGTPPTAIWNYYRNQLAGQLTARFGTDLEIKNCAKWGARVDDLIMPPHQQAIECLPSNPEPKTTLIVMTIGGNDLHNWASDFAEGATIEEVMAEAEATIDLLRDFMDWVFEPGRFPNGVYVLLSNVYEYTDATGDLNSCLVSIFSGLGGSWIEGVAPTVRFNEAIMEITVEYQVDMIFMLENFCGHGFHNTDPAGQCFIPPNGGERWFDLTCIHPNTTGHFVIADMFLKVVDE